MVKLNKLKTCSFLLIILLNIAIFGSNSNNKSYFLNSNEDENILYFEGERPSLKVANKLPDSPQLTYPLNNSLYTSNIVKFEWNPVGKPSDEVFYEFVLDNDTDFISPEAARFAINNWSNSTMAEEPYTTFLAHFDGTNKSEKGEYPKVATGLSFKPGKFGKGIFVNASSYAQLTYNTKEKLSKEKGSIEFWIKLEKDLEDINDNLIMFDYKMNDSNRIGIMILNDTKKVIVYSLVNNIPYVLYPSRETVWKRNYWHHVCLIWDDEIGRLYLDGIEEAASLYFPIGEGNDDSCTIGGIGGKINATFDEFRISSIPRLSLWKPENANVNVTYTMTFHKYPIWNLTKSEYSHMFEKDGTYYWKVRAHNASGPGEWSGTRMLTINRLLDIKYPVNIKILDTHGCPVPNANLSYQQKTVSKIMGVDAPSVEVLSKYGFKWYHKGSELNLYKFFGEIYSNSFRTRLWTSVGSKYSLENATLRAKKAQENGLFPYLSLLLSDTGCNWNHQPLPKLFEGFTFEERLSEVEEYSKNVTQHFIDEGINMEFYVIGAEIDFGICGVFASDETPRHNLTWLRDNIWYNESRIIKASINGIRQIDPDAKIMLHIAIIDPSSSLAFYTAMRDYGVPYDIIGFPYYPNAMGDSGENGFRETIKILSTSGLPGSNQIFIIETAYSSQLNASTYFPGWNKSITGFPLTPNGQKEWLKSQLEWNYQHPNIIGMNYYGPELYLLVWEGLSWFNMTGTNVGISKPVVDAYPEFFNLRNSSLSNSKISNLNGLILLDAYRGKLEITVKSGSYSESFTLIISPFRVNNFKIQLSIILPEDNDDDNDNENDVDESELIILGLYLIIVIGGVSLISISLILKKINKERK